MARGRLGLHLPSAAPPVSKSVELGHVINDPEKFCKPLSGKGF